MPSMDTFVSLAMLLQLAIAGAAAVAIPEPVPIAAETANPVPAVVQGAVSRNRATRGRGAERNGVKELCQ